MHDVYLEEFGEVSTVAVCLVLPALIVAAFVMPQTFCESGHMFERICAFYNLSRLFFCTLESKPVSCDV